MSINYDTVKRKNGIDEDQNTPSQNYVFVANVNDMTIQEAANYYKSIGIVTHPLHSRNAHVTSPGKQPLLKKWAAIDKPFTDIELKSNFNNKGNIGFICGKPSDLFIIDNDWYVKGIWQNILGDVDSADGSNNLIQTENGIGYSDTVIR